MVEILLIIIIVVLLIYIAKLTFMRKIYSNSINGISIVSNGKIVDCNSRLLNIFGYTSKKELLSEHPLRLAPAFQEDGEFSFSKAQRMMKRAEEKGNCRFDWICLHKTDGEKYIEIDIIRVDSFFGKYRYFMIWSDIDKRIAVEKKLKKLNENLEVIINNKVKKTKKQEQMILRQSRQAQIGEMLSMIAHQWRQPLGAISASTIDMQMKIMLRTLDTDKLIEYISNELQHIESFTQTLTTTIDDFRDFYKFTKNKELVSILSPIKKSHQIIAKYFQDEQIKIDIVCNEDVIVPIHESEIIQVLLSLLENSKDNFKHRKIQNPKVTISVDKSNENVILQFTDNGKGISKANLDKIFQPYFTTKEKMNGTGLGLYMAQKIIQEHHNGTIQVQNKADGICFTIILQRNI